MKVVNVKVKYIRPEYQNLHEWINDKNNEYIGRCGVVFINGERYPKKDSKWANPFTIKKYGSRETVIKLYKEYIIEKIKNKELDIDELNWFVIVLLYVIYDKYNKEVDILLFQNLQFPF